MKHTAVDIIITPKKSKQLSTIQRWFVLVHSMERNPHTGERGRILSWCIKRFGVC